MNDQEILDAMKEFGMLRYPIEKIINLVSPSNPSRFVKDFKNKNSAIRQAYEKGKDQGDYMLDKSLWNLIQTGDIQAYDRLMTRISMYEEI